jgi:hypothetical protein
MTSVFGLEGVKFNEKALEEKMIGPHNAVGET